MENFNKKIIVAIVCALFFMIDVKGQIGLQQVIVEKYYVSNAADSVGSVGLLPVGSVTYRIYVDMRQGYKFQMAYGSSAHPMSISTTSSFFNNEDYGATTPAFTKSNAAKNTVMLDSWLSAGAACVGNFGILKAEDNTVANVVNVNGLLQNTSPYAGIPLTTRDGLISGTPGVVGTIGIDTEIAVFDGASQYGNTFYVTNGAWFCLAGATGYDTTNKVLIAQITTKGIFMFKLNLQLGTPDGNVEIYVAENPVGAEVQSANLVFSSDTTFTNVYTSENDISILIYPNPSNRYISIDITGYDNMMSANFYTVYDMLGNAKITKSFVLSGNKYHENIDISDFPVGVYIIQTYISGEKRTNKIIIN